MLYKNNDIWYKPIKKIVNKTRRRNKIEKIQRKRNKRRFTNQKR